MVTGSNIPTQIDHNAITRREFLHFCSFNLLGLFITTLLPTDRGLEQQGRVLQNGVKIYDIPSLHGKILGTLWKDMLLNIKEVTIGDDEPSFNRVWYRIKNSEYVHSGSIQPVQTHLNQIVSQIPKSGILTEVTVPYTDAHWGADRNYPVAYRLYFGTTHWVIDIAQDKYGSLWYLLADDKWNIRYYTPAEHLRLVPTSELTPISSEIPNMAKRLKVDTSKQIVVAYEFDKPVFITKAATGAKYSNGNFSTPIGSHITFHKRPFRHMAAGNLAYNGYDLPGVPWVTYITRNGVSFHGTYWHNNFGNPHSHGCINLTPEAAKWIYRWTNPFVPHHTQFIYQDTGTLVEVI